MKMIDAEALIAAMTAKAMDYERGGYDSRFVHGFRAAISVVMSWAEKGESDGDA